MQGFSYFWETNKNILWKITQTYTVVLALPEIHLAHFAQILSNAMIAEIGFILRIVLRLKKDFFAGIVLTPICKISVKYPV